MKVNIERSKDRGKGDQGWLKSSFSYSFAGYQNPKRMQFGALRVLNDDTFSGGNGFDFHAHDNMEIVTLVLDGKLRHRDSMGNSEVVSKDEIQHMSAGSGIVHSEFNDSPTEPVSLLQIWLFPKEQNIQPAFSQAKPVLQKNRLNVVVSGFSNRPKEALYLHQNAQFLLGEFDAKQKIVHSLQSNSNGLFVFVIDGEIKLENETLSSRDSAEVSGSSTIAFETLKKSKLFLIEVPLN